MLLRSLRTILVAFGVAAAALSAASATDGSARTSSAATARTFAPRVLAAGATYYDAPYYWSDGHINADGNHDSVSDTAEAFWAAYQNTWGVGPPNCNFHYDEYDGTTSGVFARMYESGSSCGGGPELVLGTPYSIDLGKNAGTGAGCDGGEGDDGKGGGSGSGSGSEGGPTCQSDKGAAGDDNGPLAGDPINTATGNKYLQEDDYASHGFLTFRRFYNSSTSAGETGIGTRWTHSFNRIVARVYDNSGNATIARITRPSGAREIFNRVGSQWTATPENPDRLTEADDASGNPTGYTLWIAALRHTETYGADGALLSISDATGQTATLGYSNTLTDPAIAPKAGLLLTVTAPDGRLLSFTYDANARIHQVTLPDGGTLIYGYDATGNLTSVQYPDGKTRQYVYNESTLTGGSNLPSAMTGLVDENGVRFEDTAFDGTGRATSTQFSGGAGKVSIAYNSDGSSDVTYPLGGTSHQGYTTVQGLVRVETLDKPCGECGQPYASRTYDANSRPATYTDFNGNIRAVTYDANGLLTEEIDAQGSADQRTTDTTWNTTLRVPLVSIIKDNMGKVLSKSAWAYNANGQTTAACLIDPVAAPSYTCAATGTAPAGVRRSVMTYCTTVNGTTCPLTGLLLKVDGPRTDVTDTATYAYYLTTDESGCATAGGACHRLGDVKTTTDGAGLITTNATYDKAGRPTRIKAPNGVLTDLTYTPRGWLATKTVRASAAGTPSTSDATTTLAYNPDGTVHSATDPDGVVTTYTYDAAHRLTDVTDASGNRIHYALDASGNRTSEQILTSKGTVTRSLGRAFNLLGQLTSLNDGLGRTVFSAASTDSYDGNGNLVHSTDGLGVQQKHVFDGLDRLVSTLKDYQGTNAATANSQTVTTFDALDRTTGFSDPDGLNTTYDIDGLGNRTGLHSPDTGSSARTFDIAGNVTTSTDATNVSHTSTYDADNRLLTTSYADTTLNVQYKYDEADSVTGCTGSVSRGRLTRVVEGNGGLIYCYDRRGNVVKKQQTIGTATRTTTYTWTLANRLKSVTTPNGTAVAYTRNALGQITAVKVTPMGGTATNVASAVTYRPFGPVATYKLGDGQTVTLAYDSTGALTDIASTAYSLHVKRDVMGNVVDLGNTAVVPSPSETYGYDALYRLTGVTAATGAAIEAYTYNKTGDRLTKAGPGLLTGAYNYAPNTHHLMGVGTTTRQVDARGNTTADVLASGTYGYGYNDRNRLTIVQNNGATVGSYVLNAQGLRVQKTAGTVVTRFDYDEEARLLSDNNGMTTRDYVWMDNLLVGVVDGAGTTTTVNFVHADGMGSPRTVTSSTGALLWQWAYASNPFGENVPTSTVGYTLNLRFPGQYFDVESGLNYNVNRDYEAAAGRYVQSDPSGLAGGATTYAYVGDAPLSWIDWLALFDPNAYKNFMDRHAKNASQGQCARYIRQGLEAGGADTSGHPIDAKDYGPTLVNNGFSAVPDDGYVPHVGDTAVFQPPGGGSAAGHIETWDGDHWVSDFNQRSFYANHGYETAPHQIYRPPAEQQH
ncbi:RHS repeat-associated core domain-containing protein [Xanthomonas sp. NCPPB 2632]|uniref:RHS repeat-associated core domain-containing protein n=1 Tax=Xanthomonas sp. NCPPB 2632 TaxID=3240912 RepID=UPI003517F4CE